MKIILIILSIIGLLKLVSLFIVCGIEIYYSRLGIDIDGINKNYGFYKDHNYYLIPTINISKTDKYLEIEVKFLCFIYYNAYNVNKDE